MLPLHDSPPKWFSHHGRRDSARRAFAWSVDDAEEALWACIWAPERLGVNRPSLVEGDTAVSWQVEVVTATATLTTAPRRCRRWPTSG